MAGLYQFANTPNGSTIPLAQLDYNFTYLQNEISGNLTVTSFAGGTTGLLPAAATSGAITLSGVLSVANGGTGSTSSSGALTNLLPAQTGQAGKFLTTDGNGNLSWATGGVSGTVGIANGGTGLNSVPTSGQLLIGNGTGYTLGTLTAGTGISISNTAGGITINATGGGGGGGTVTSVGLTSSLSGVNVSGGTITTSGTFNLTGTLGVGSGGTGLSAIGTANQYLAVNSTATGLTWASSTVAPGSITPAMLSTGGPSWDTSGNLTVANDITAADLTLSGGITAATQIKTSAGFWGQSGYFAGQGTLGNNTNIALLTGSFAVNFPGPVTALSLSSAGNGNVLGTWGCGTQMTIQSTSGGVLTLKAPATATNTTITFPLTAGTAGQVLSTDGAGNTSWVTGGGGGGVIPPGTVTPAMLSTGGPSWDTSSNLTVAGGITATTQIKTSAGFWGQSGYFAGQGTVGSTTNIALLTGSFAVNFPGGITALAVSSTGNGNVIGTWGCGTQTTIQSTSGGVLTLRAPVTATNTTITFPLTAGTAGQVLSTDGAGNTSWVAAGGGSIPAGTVTPAMLSTGGPSWDTAGELTVTSGISANAQIKTTAAVWAQNGYFAGQGTVGNTVTLAMLSSTIAFNFPGIGTVANFFPTGNFVIQGAGYQPGGGTWTATSDSRVKSDVEPYQLSVADLETLSPVTYKYNGLYGTSNDGKTHHGFIAQDVLNTPFKSMVNSYTHTDKETDVSTEVYTVNTTQLVFALLNAVKELNQRIAALEAKG